MAKTGIVKISEAASLALHTMALLASEAEGPIRVTDMARTFDVSEAHLAKVLQRLARAGLVNGTRGPHGGFTLPKGGDRVTLLRVYEAIEGPLEASRCLLTRPVCDGKRCMMGGTIRQLNEALRRKLAGTRLRDLARAKALFHGSYGHATKHRQD